MEIIINIGKDFSKSPGGRYEKFGSRDSGEEFKENYFIPSMLKILQENQINPNSKSKLIIELDDIFESRAYTPDFLDEAFCVSIKSIINETNFTFNDIKNTLEFKSERFKHRVDKIWKDLNNEFNKPKKVPVLTEEEIIHIQIALGYFASSEQPIVLGFFAGSEIRKKSFEFYKELADKISEFTE